MRTVNLALLAFVVLSIFVVAARSDQRGISAAPATSPPAIDWGNVGKKVSGDLHKRDLLTWSDELAGDLANADAETLQVAAEVFRRAGQPARMSQAILGLGKTSLAGRRGSDWDMVERLLKLGWHEQARAWFDTFPARCLPPADMQGFVKWLVAREGADRAENWLRGKARNEVAVGMFWERNWTRTYWDYLAGTGKLAEHVNALAERIKQSPTDADLVFEYVGARSNLPEQQRLPPIWLAETTRLERALHNFALGQMFRGDDPPEAAIQFYDRSLACPVIDYDRQHFNEFSGWSMYVAPEEAEKHLRRAAKAGLAEACFKAKKLDRAQKLVEELTGKKDGTLADLGPFQFAGQVQAASGQRVVEDRIKKAEAENKDSIRYWLNRAKYYCGRNELQKAEEAYQAALKLPADPENSWHFDAVRDYGGFLVGQKRLGDADRVYRDELKRIGPKDPQASYWLNQLQDQADHGLGPRLKWDEPIVWDYLAGQKDFFGDDAQRRFQWVAERAGKDGAIEFEKKARALVADPCPPRLQFFFGGFLRGRGATQEGTRMMAEAYERSPRTEWPGDPRGTEEMLQVYLAQNDLPGAEKMLDRLLGEISYGNNPRWLGEFALIAAGNRAPDMAMRLWRVKANLDLTEQAGLETLAANGLADRLRDFYAGLARQAPDNAFVAAALKKCAKL